MTYKDGSRYEGEWKSGLRQGHGVLYFDEKDEKFRLKYEGGWDQDLFSGFGTIHLKATTTTLPELQSHFWNYTSQLEGSLLNAYNFNIRVSNETKFSGYFKDGYPNGQGVLTAKGFLNDSLVDFRLDGDFTNGNKTGKTNVRLTADPALKISYNGTSVTFKQFEAVGHFLGNSTLRDFLSKNATEQSRWNGTYAWAIIGMEYTYTGLLLDRQQHGQGAQTTKITFTDDNLAFIPGGVAVFSNISHLFFNGSDLVLYNEYDGEWVNGVKQGFGRENNTLNNYSVSSYEGQFLLDKYNGWGIKTTKEGNFTEVHEGYFKNHLASGNGTRTRSTGVKTVGTWSEGKLNGEAVLYFPNSSDDIVSIKGVFLSTDIVDSTK